MRNTMAPAGGKVGAAQNGDACVPIQESGPHSCDCSSIVAQETQLSSRQEMVTGFGVHPEMVTKQNAAVPSYMNESTQNKIPPSNAKGTSGYATASTSQEYSENLSIESVSTKENTDTEVVSPPPPTKANKMATKEATAFVHGITSNTYVNAPKSEPLYPQMPVVDLAKAGKTDREDSTGNPPTASSLEGYEDATEESSLDDPVPPPLYEPSIYAEDEYHGYDRPYPWKFFNSNAEKESQDLDLESPSPSRGVLLETPPTTPTYIRQGPFFTFAGEEMSTDSGFASASTSTDAKFE